MGRSMFAQCRVAFASVASGETPRRSVTTGRVAALIEQHRREPPGRMTRSLLVATDEGALRVEPSVIGGSVRGMPPALRGERQFDESVLGKASVSLSRVTPAVLRSAPGISECSGTA
jgi:hypothetical protein